MATQKKKLTGDALRTYEDDSNLGFKKRWKEKAREDAVRGAKKAVDGPLVAVAEGDSWFDYKPSYLSLGRDLLGHLRSFDRVDIHRESKAGDTLENMVYGTAYHSRTFKPKRAQHEKTLDAIDKFQPDLFLFSGGGNDVAGTELEAFLNHADSGQPTLRQPYVDEMFGEIMPKTFQTMIDMVKSRKADIQIFLHGYDYAVPDGRGVGVKLIRWTFVGPWLRPALTKKRVASKAARRAIIVDMINRLNNVLAELAATNANVHHIDVRGTLRTDQKYKKDWANELHPTSDGFKLVARKFQEKIDEAFSLSPP